MSELERYRALLEDHFLSQPVATVAQAQAEILRLTGIQRGLSQVRHFLKTLGLKWRKVGGIPAKADPQAQARFLKGKLEPRLAESRAGQRHVFFVDAAHFVWGAYFGYLWLLVRLLLPTPAGRKRLSVLGAVEATRRRVRWIDTQGSITHETVCQLLRMLDANVQGPITLVCDRARYFTCQIVQDLAKQLEIEMLYLPPYSPNLNLIERLWKFVKKTCLYSKHYETFAAFTQSIQTCLQETNHRHKPALSTLLTQNFQLFDDVPLLAA